MSPASKKAPLSASHRTALPRRRATAAEMKASKSAPRQAYLLALKLENIRCFGPEQTLNLMLPDGKPARWTVILGNNSVGKTTLLEALTLMLPVPTAVKLGKGFAKEIRGVVPRLGREQNILSDAGLRPWQRRGAENGHFVLCFGRSPTLTEFSEQSLAQAGLEEDGITSRMSFESSVGSIAYAYGANRRAADGPLSEELSNDPTATLFRDSAMLRNPEEWLLQTYLAASMESPLQTSATKQIARVRDILVRVLPGVMDVRVVPHERPGKQVRAIAEVQTEDGWIPMSALGLGYRTMTAWMVDLASRLFERYPDLNDPLAGPAVCLVDEIDLHLHPRWQRQLIPHLTQVFKETQFVVTAHSPLIVQAVQDGNLAVLRREGDHVVIDQGLSSVRNWRLDQILTSDLFDLPSARPPALDALLAERDALLAKSTLRPADLRRLEALRNEIGELPGGDTPEDMEAMDVLRRVAKKLSQGRS